MPRMTAGILASAIVLGTSATALAQYQVGDTIGLSVSEIASNLENGGYVIREIDVETNRIEAEVTFDGKKLEIEISRDTGEVIKVERD